MKRIALTVLGLFVLVAATSTVVDLLIITEEEDLDIFVQHITNEDQNIGIDHALDYVDPNREDVRLSANDETTLYSEGEEADLAMDLRGILSEEIGDVESLVQKDINIEDSDARVGVRIRAQRGLVDAVFEFRRHEDGWLLKSIRIG